jgi:hypothetical protein
MEFSMRNLIPFLAAGVASFTAVPLAQAQTADTATAASRGAVIVAQQAAPIETVETVHTVSTATTPAKHVARHPAQATGRVTTTRSYAQADVAGAPPPPPPYVALPPPIGGPRYYNMVPPGPAVPPPPGVLPADAGVVAPVPAYRYVYEPGRILVIDPYTNIAVQALPR